MASHHLSSKNLTSGEKLALMDALKEEIRKDNEEKNRKQLLNQIKQENPIHSNWSAMKNQKPTLKHGQIRKQQKKQV